ncbi:nicotinate phosphoribosyltransferase [Acidiferrimicrobium sp. IK]|uniref:nicotinate phosphoribosyltransferase n=1 Tax=Acidiferrimicrobium sp. IK TaxID=2871700 RepID=UPI0021CAE68B|nr:nicotinate phosphoribosyltransferase [Acidiferrimicrobium sp. IK]MCU4186953.1 nicotinate phosphoribosyltransferase [Acidiferrimicrobium sp. IK]
MNRPSTALLTDHYELTMLEGALRSGVASHPATFEVFTRRLPAGRGYGVFAGLGRLLDAMEDFRFGPEEIGWLAQRRIVDSRTLEWLASYRFSGDVHAYREGELYTAGSPVLTVEGRFGEAVLLETLVLSILNHDSAIAAAAELLVRAAAGRPVIEMGSRRTDTGAAVAAARAAYLAGFASSSNLEAGRRWGVPTAGTSAHAFTLVHDSERDAFAAQVAALGPDTTLLVDTFDTDAGIRLAVEVAGKGLGAVRIDSGDLVREARAARRLLDELGNTETRVVVTGDLDDRSIAALAAAPVDGYGVGTNLVTGLGHPTAGFVYKLVSVGPDGGAQRPVAKQSPGKATVGGRKWAWRACLDGPPPVYEGPPVLDAGPVWADVVGVEADPPPAGGRPLQDQVVTAGRIASPPPLEELRAAHAASSAQLQAGRPLIVVRRD